MVRRVCSYPIDRTVSGQFRNRCDRTGGGLSVRLLVSPLIPLPSGHPPNLKPTALRISSVVSGCLAMRGHGCSSARVVEIYKDRRDSPPPSAHSELWAAHAKNQVAHSVSPAAITSTGVPSMLLCFISHKARFASFKV